MATQELYCQGGDHHWSRPSQRGKKPIHCPEHRPEKAVVTSNIKPKKERKKREPNLEALEKARKVKEDARKKEGEAWAEKIEAVCNSPEMTRSLPYDKYMFDARRETPAKLRYIHEQLTTYRSQRTPNDIADLERIRDRIMADPYNRSGHQL